MAYASLDYKVKVQYADTPYGYNLYNLDLVQAPCEWNQGTTGSKNIAVCIIDSGIQTDHPDLRANIWVNTAEIPNNGIDDDGNGMSVFYCSCTDCRYRANIGSSGYVAQCGIDVHVLFPPNSYILLMRSHRMV